MLLHVVTSLLLAAAPEVATTAETPAAPAAPVEKKICRKDIETGSLIKGKKICYTAKQWQKMADAARDDIDSRVSSGSSSGR